MTIKEQLLERIDQTGDKHPGQVNLCADILEMVAIESTMWIENDVANIPTLIIEASRVLRKRAKELEEEYNEEVLDQQLQIRDDLTRMDDDYEQLEEKLND